MEQFYKDRRTPLRMRESPLGAYVDALARQLSEEGYARASARYALQLVASLGRWMARRKIVAGQLTPEHIERYLDYRSRHRHYRSGDAAIVRRLLKLLREKGIVAPAPPIERSPTQRLEEEFRHYLERERRLAPATVLRYLPVARRFLAECFADAQLRLDSLRAADVVRFVQREAARLHHPKRAKLMTTALRSFLQYARYRVGAALAEYLRHSRPACSARQVFVRMRAPNRGFASSAAISSIVHRALDRAGLNPAHKGAHLLRHSVATQMLRQGASLAEIGELLRHRSQQTTMIYAKVDLDMLRPLALPWPGGAQ